MTNLWMAPATADGAWVPLGTTTDFRVIPADRTDPEADDQFISTWLSPRTITVSVALPSSAARRLSRILRSTRAGERAMRSDYRRRLKARARRNR